MLFKNKVLNFVDENGFSRVDLYFTDENGINWKSFPRKSLAYRREMAVSGFKVSKEMTGMVYANPSCTHALPVLVIRKSKKPKCFKNTQLPATYRPQKSTLMNSDISTDWCKSMFMPNKQEHKEHEVLLLIDNVQTHPSAEILNAINDEFEVLFLLRNVTPSIQSMDQGIIDKVKQMYRKHMLHRLIWAKVVGGHPGFKECDESDCAEWLDSDKNDMGYKILNDNVTIIHFVLKKLEIKVTVKVAANMKMAMPDLCMPNCSRPMRQRCPRTSNNQNAVKLGCFF
ncbi:hypothetical protein PR048_016926 [Dryococelus australis]|uniref:DDE-1 domain-containing protein n=1 Tax=Dryococelus australis TaxID=614101 RepID=A0ABQ9H824_9NEOP|nr:hypothetical protein PR048_016926 [Dryococelus australis]